MSALVLVAARDPQRLARLKALVEKEGGAVITASDRLEAMRLFIRSAPVMALLHVDPDGEIGTDLCRDMKSLKAARGRSVFIVGARAVRPEAFAAGCDAFVQGQTDQAPLAQSIRRFLERTRRTRSFDSIEAVG